MGGESLGWLLSEEPGPGPGGKPGGASLRLLSRDGSHRFGVVDLAQTGLARPRIAPQISQIVREQKNADRTTDRRHTD